MGCQASKQQPGMPTELSEEAPARSADAGHAQGKLPSLLNGVPNVKVGSEVDTAERSEPTPAPTTAKNERRVTVEVPDVIPSPDAGFTRTSKRKCTPWHGQNQAEAGVVLSDEDDDEDSDSDEDQKADAKQQGGPKVKIVAPATKSGEKAGPGFTRTSKRKSTPWHGQAGAGVRVALSDDEESEDSTDGDRAGAKQNSGPRVTIVAPPGGHDAAQAGAVFPRTSKRKSTPWHGQAGAGVTAADLGEEESDEDSEEEQQCSNTQAAGIQKKDVPKVTIVSPSGAAHDMQKAGPAFSRTSKRKSTPWHGQAAAGARVVVSDDDDSADEDSDDQGAGDKRKVGIPKVTIVAPPEDNDAEKKAGGSFSRTSKRKATPFLGAGRGGPVVVSDSEDSDGSVVHWVPSTDAVQKRVVRVVAPEVEPASSPPGGAFTRTAGRKATPFLGGGARGPIVQIDDDVSGDSETSEDENHDVPNEARTSSNQDADTTFQRSSKRKATPWHAIEGAGSGSSTTVGTGASDASLDRAQDADAAEPREDPPQNFARSSQRKATPWHSRGGAAGISSADEEDEDEHDAFAEETTSLPARPKASKMGGLFDWASCCVQDYKDAEEFDVVSGAHK